ncbi:hypothetical protein [Legionella worsleiensis]|uniref:Uncharacterized protein n=1 Tax=Legionella worsleiensis TaxID=45076 RepID=A0A0W1AHC2_9GAMM|nr:hypothetical protein [Legionella worsleiensis]KTD80757.1 hypothetical protein Lwor_1000 [Legionella worsleiensis]STY32664.1 Uncharacterised protein [Legionella worsleiensis]
MTQFEKNYILSCLNSLDEILNDANQLDTAITNFSGHNNTDLRYCSNLTITDAPLWSDQEKKAFSAAFFEATARANYTFLTTPELAQTVSQAQSIWWTHYKPLLSANTDTENRIQSVIANIKQIKSDLINEIPSDAPPDVTMKNKYPFFTALAAVGVAALIGTVVAMKP